ncbi:unnamed protein product [Onchocerca flexuosa]|uniref:Transposase n=1 Tax=Onchocerca flexuosa TaxID=387005 RepID=A0A183HSJ1_9BILA|nr:unnamed protein product [Onchocerca flexuosa]
MGFVIEIRAKKLVRNGVILVIELNFSSENCELKLGTFCQEILWWSFP